MSEVWVKRTVKGTIEIRLAAKDNIEAICEVDGIISRALNWAPLIEAHLRKYVEKNQAFVAVFNGQIIGYALYYDKNEIRHFVRGAVLHDFRRMKIYSALVLLRMFNSQKRKFTTILEVDELISKIAERIGFLVEHLEESINIVIPTEYSFRYANHRIAELLQEYGWHPQD